MSDTTLIQLDGTEYMVDWHFHAGEIKLDEVSRKWPDGLSVLTSYDMRRIKIEVAKETIKTFQQYIGLLEGR